MPYAQERELNAAEQFRADTCDVRTFCGREKLERTQSTGFIVSSKRRLGD
jgi:hypothetical protein